MEIIKSFKDFLSEKKENKEKEEDVKKEKNQKKKYDFACLMADVDSLPTEDIEIKDEDIFNDEEGGYGKETKPHVTVLYGIHEEVEPSEIEEFLKNVSAIDDVTLTEISLFENEEYDVVKYDVESKQLHKLNKKIRDTFPYTSNFPDYHPHLTICYCKPKTGKKYCKKFEEPIEIVPITKLSLSTPSGKKYHYTLKKKDKKK